MKNTTKLSIASTLLLLGSLAHAQNPMEGFYAGAQLGKASMDLAGDYSLVPPSPITDKTHINRSYDEATYGLYTGYGWYKQNTFYGLELGVDQFQNNIEDFFESNPKHAFLVENKFKLNLSGLYGKQLDNNLLVYGRLGLTYTDIEVTAITKRDTDFFVGSVHDWIGGTIGAGLAYPISDHLAIRGEYGYTTYFAGPDYNNDKNDGEKTAYDFDDHRLMIGLTYSF